jgi:hypothetical protein
MTKITTEETALKLAVLIDADNARAVIIDRVLATFLRNCNIRKITMTHKGYRASVG